MGPKFVEITRIPGSTLIQQNNMGESAARNKGISKANAELIAFLDADDTWEPTFLETILRLRSTYPDAGAYATAYYICNRKGEKTKVKLSSIPSEKWEGILPNYFKVMATENFEPFYSSSICIPKHVFQQIGEFCVGEHTGADLDMWYRIALNYPIAYSTLPGANYYFDVLFDNIFTKERIKKVTSEMQYIKNLRIALNNSNVSDDTKKWIKIILSKADLYMAKIHIINKNSYKAIATLLSSKISLYNKICWIMLTIFPTRIFKLGFTLKQYIKR